MTGQKVDKRLELSPPGHLRIVLAVEHTLYGNSRLQHFVFTERKTANQGRGNSEKSAHDINDLRQVLLLYTLGNEITPTTIHNGPERAVERSAARYLRSIEVSILDTFQDLFDLYALDVFARRDQAPPGELRSPPPNFLTNVNAKRGARLPIEREHEDLFPRFPQINDFPHRRRDLWVDPASKPRERGIELLQVPGRVREIDIVGLVVAFITLRRRLFSRVTEGFVGRAQGLAQ